MFDFLFDSNSVRNCARNVPNQAEWDAIRTAWKKGEYKTAWIPWTIGEVIGTNLASETQPATDADCEQVALAVRRFDQLAARDILIGPRRLIHWSMNRYLGVDTGSPYEELHRKSLEAAKSLQGVSQLRIQRSADQIVVFIRNPQTGDEEGQTIPTGFVEHVDHRVERWKQRLTEAEIKTDYAESDVIPKEPLLEFLWKQVPKSVVAMAKQAGLSDKSILSFEGKITAEILMHPFVYGAVAQDWYYILRALNVKTGKVLETLGRDLVISNYIPLAKTFVTSDVDFAKLVKDVLPADVINFGEFKARLLNAARK